MRSVSHLAGVSINTVTKVLVDAGEACYDYQDRVFRNLRCKRIQCDEIWSFSYSKEKKAAEDKEGQFGYGHVYTWTAIDAETKLIPSWHVGTRGYPSAKIFIQDLAARLAHGVQLTTDGHSTYLWAVEDPSDKDIDSQLMKLYGGDRETEVKYGPAHSTEASKKRIEGNPDMKHISSSYGKKQNLRLRKSMRRSARLPDGFTNKIENHCHALSLYFMFHNFVRIHNTLRMSPAMAAGITDKLWSMEDIDARGK